jgi:hypothetical protein
MLIQERARTEHQHPQVPAPDAGVIDDARARQRRQRLGLVLLVAAALAVAAVFSFTGGGGSGGRRPSGRVSRGDASNVSGASLRLGRGQSSSIITIKAPADHAYDVMLRAQPGAEFVLSANFGAPGPIFSTQTDRQFCRMTAGSTVCSIHFAAGGNFGGTWRWRLTKTSLPAARVSLRFVFAAQRGDYPG